MRRLAGELRLPGGLRLPTDLPITFPVRHTFMMNDQRVRRVIRDLLDRVVPLTG
jgi:hypothetical protein